MRTLYKFLFGFFIFLATAILAVVLLGPAWGKHEARKFDRALDELIVSIARNDSNPKSVFTGTQSFDPADITENYTKVFSDYFFGWKDTTVQFPNGTRYTIGMRGEGGGRWTIDRFYKRRP